MFGCAQTGAGQGRSLAIQMSVAAHSPSTQHKQAASAHELAARQHRAAAEFHDKRMEHAARLSSTSAKACCMQAHAQSMLACEHSAEKSPPG